MQQELISEVILITVVSFLVLRSIQIIFFQPYRNRFMVWYMKRFSIDYRRCSKMFNFLLNKQKELRKQSISLADSYYSFFQLLQSDDRFRSLDQIEESVFGKTEHREMDPEKLITENTLPLRDFEQFVYFSGKGDKLHKIVVSFDFGDGIHLQYIWFFYHEEDSSHYFFDLKKKRFPPDDDRKGRNENIPSPQPSHAKKIPVPQN